MIFEQTKIANTVSKQKSKELLLIFSLHFANKIQGKRINKFEFIKKFCKNTF